MGASHQPHLQGRLLVTEACEISTMSMHMCTAAMQDATHNNGYGWHRTPQIKRYTLQLVTHRGDTVMSFLNK